MVTVYINKNELGYEDESIDFIDATAAKVEDDFLVLYEDNVMGRKVGQMFLKYVVGFEIEVP